MIYHPLELEMLLDSAPPLADWERERLEFLQDVHRERQGGSPKRRLAAGLVRLGIRLDPDQDPCAERDIDGESARDRASRTPVAIP